METLAEIAAIIARNVSKDGFHATPIEHVTLVRSSTVTMPMPSVYRPQLCLVAQGRKEVTLGDRVFRYAPGRYGVVTYDLPAIGQVVEATPDKPYLCLYLDFDPVMLGDLALRVPPPPGVPPLPVGKTVSDAGAGLLDAALRLLRLLDDPAALPVLGPLAEQEILYRLLAGPDSARMRHITSSQGRVALVGRAIAWIGKHFRERFSIEQLAAEAGMSPSSLHEHFRAVTAMTPLQFQKQLRLQDARSLMLVHDVDVTTAAFRVGYESPTQFSREYRRHFGEPPARDIARLRASPDLAVALNGYGRQASL
ncbi:AraC family transcriptional regulator [Paraburkholderia silvatlantica]|uniref:AraC family transcriptional regulator n=1 Tax=Paraburkholderia silvatlantica TaxID=321895 RepID=UPI00105E7A72|nr:AraC family transcriptional regulator [Paraburkholderia silvatlantica]TDQ89510.1 AraC family transcriptional regulator [Paraburkholderia silvatlantica]